MGKRAILALSMLALLLGVAAGGRGALIVLGVFAMVAAGLFAPLWALWRWRGGWRLSAGVLASVIAVVALRIVIGVSRDPTSHNLWPFELLVPAVFNSVALSGMTVLRRMLGVSDAA